MSWLRALLINGRSGGKYLSPLTIWECNAEDARKQTLFPNWRVGGSPNSSFSHCRFGLHPKFRKTRMFLSISSAGIVLWLLLSSQWTKFQTKIGSLGWASVCKRSQRICRMQQLHEHRHSELRVREVRWRSCTSLRHDQQHNLAIWIIAQRESTVWHSKNDTFRGGGLKSQTPVT